MQQLSETGDFLTLTLANPDGLAPFKFKLKNDISVEVWDTGIIYFEPQVLTNKDIVLSCGIHGNETAPIEICAELVSDILLEKLPLEHRLLVIFGNPPAINQASREVTENLNRLFSGHHSKGAGLTNAERKRAKALEEYVGRFFNGIRVTDSATRNRCLYDLHTAIRGSRFEKFAVCPFLHGAPWQRNQFNFLLACGVDTVLLMQSPATTFSYFASATFGAAAFTIELGKVHPFGQNDMGRFSQTRNTLRELVSQPKLITPLFDQSNFNIYQVYRSIIKQTQDFRLHFADAVENFTTYPVGTLLATDGDTEYRVEQEGEAIIFPNAKVAVGQRAMLMVTPASIADNVV